MHTNYYVKGFVKGFFFCLRRDAMLIDWACWISKEQGNYSTLECTGLKPQAFSCE